MTTETSNTLHPIIWKNTEWAVTEYGVEALDGSYAIEWELLVRPNEDFDEPLTYEWPMHIATKSWVHIEEFLSAWLVAAIHFNRPLDAVSFLGETLKRSREVFAQCRRPSSRPEGLLRAGDYADEVAALFADDERRAKAREGAEAKAANKIYGSGPEDIRRRRSAQEEQETPS